MAEESIKYNVEIDQESLAQQLAQVRQQLDETMGQMAYASDVLPSAQAFTGATSGTINPVIPNYDASQAFTNQGFMDNMGAAFDMASNQTRVGAQRFGSDLRVAGLLTQPRLPLPPSGPPTFQRGSSGFWGGLAGTVSPSFSGFDYDHSGMTRRDYQMGAYENVASSFDMFSNSSFFSSAAGIATLPFGIVPGLIGWGAGMALDVGMSAAFGNIQENESLAQGFKAIAGENFGRINSTQARAMASVLQNKVYSYEGAAMNYNMDTLQNNVMGFAQAGGFSNVTNADDMQSTLEGVVNNTRQFANNFKMKQQEAVQVMAQLARDLEMDTKAMGDFSFAAARVSDQVGVSAADLTGFGLQGSNMVRGTGMSNATGFHMAVDARTQVERIRRMSPEMNSLVTNMGGSESVAYSQMEQSLRYISSGQGLISLAALANGTGVPTDMQGTISGASGYLAGDINNYFRLQANAGKMTEQIGLPQIQAMQVAQSIDMLKNLTGNSTVDETALVGFMAQQQGITPAQARIQIKAVMDAEGNAMTAAGNMRLDRLLSVQQRGSDIGIIGAIRGSIREGYESSNLVQGVRSAGRAVRDFGARTTDSIEDVFDFVLGNERIRSIDKLSANGQVALGSIADDAFYRATVEREGSGALGAFKAAQVSSKEGAMSVIRAEMEKMQLGGAKITTNSLDTVYNALMSGEGLSAEDLDNLSTEELNLVGALKGNKSIANFKDVAAKAEASVAQISAETQAKNALGPVLSKNSGLVAALTERIKNSSSDIKFKKIDVERLKAQMNASDGPSFEEFMSNPGSAPEWISRINESITSSETADARDIGNVKKSVGPSTSELQTMNSLENIMTNFVNIFNKAQTADGTLRVEITNPTS